MHENDTTPIDSLPEVLREATAGASPERALVIRELTAIAALRFVDPVLYGSMVELGRSYTEPAVILFNEWGEAVDDDSFALRRRNAEGYLAAARFGACPRCYFPCVTYPDGRRLAWPSLDHHDACTDIADEVQVKPPAQPERKTRRRVVQE